ncbi:alpha/beta hydrolase [Flavobacterium sp. LC2016-01]|uniref:alpha/beta fold hydrolase n=1 Tax=Flavobacterium sp. LC2016-01 TaxID=2675876 RepID=UPI0012BA66C8|nr:alpha/beta hydrolase [Flavobacterium sp. LC2016-01]MTH17715.1 alpha/beta fold hydrolase [Flavobacterium sp. LC2016-01]
MKNQVYYKTANIDGLTIFYRETGVRKDSTLLLLHGFPSSSHMYRDLIAILSESFHVIAPDYPGFGQSSAPTLQEYNYTFDTLSDTIEHFIDHLDLRNINLYIQDYGGPIGMRIALRRPELISSLIIQNANAYLEGLGEALAPLTAYIENQNNETESKARFFLTLEATKWQYFNGAENVDKISPDSYTLDQYYLDRPGNDLIQLALFRDYGSNVMKYDDWQDYFRKHQPPALVVWGKNDVMFVSAGGDAYKKDLPNAQVFQINGGHFLLEEHHSTVAQYIHDFLSHL